MARITHPRPTLGRTRPGVGGVVFQDGVAEVDLTDKPILHDFYLRHGYEIDYDIDELADEAEVNIPISALTIAELRKVAEQNGVEIPKGVKLKEDIVELVETTLAARKLAAAGGVTGADSSDGAVAVGSVLKLTDEGHDLLGGDENTRATVLELSGDERSALVEWNGGLDHPTTLSLSLTQLADD